MSIPSLRFPQFSKQYETVALLELCDLITKGTTPKAFSEDGVNYIKIECFEENRIDPTKCSYINGDVHETDLKRSILKEDDILFAIAGATIGKCNIVTKDILPANTNQALAIIRLKNKKSVGYIYQILISQIMKKYIDNNVVVGAQPNLNLEQLGAFLVPLPEFEEQVKISDFFGSVDKKTISLKLNIDLLLEYKKSLMREIFSQNIYFKDSLGKRYSEWQQIRLHEICDIEKGEQLNKTEMVESGQFPVLNGGISFSGFTSEWNSEGNTIAISEGGNSCGYVSLIPTRFWAGGHCYTLKNLHPNIAIQYLFQFLKYQQDAIMRLRVGSGLPNIQKRSLSEFCIQLPSIEEQQKISSFLSALDNKISNFQRQLELTKQYKQGLLQQMFV